MPPQKASATGSSNEASQDAGEKRSRGRKLTETNKYIKDSRAKIRQWQEDLKNKKNTREEMHSLRNKISALESRISKRIKLRNLQEKI